MAPQSMPLRVLHLIHQYPPHHLGGSELYTQTLARRQAKLEYSVAVFSPTRMEPEEDSQPVTLQIEDAVRVYRVPVGKRSPTRVFFSTFANPAIERGWQRVLDLESPDLVHVQHLIGLPMGLVACLRVRRIPYVVTLHDYWFFCANAQLVTNYSQQSCGGPRLWVNCGQCALARIGRTSLMPLAPALAPIFGYRHWRLRRVLDGARAIIAPTESTRTIYQRMGLPRSKIRVIPHGIEIPPDVAQGTRANRVSSQLRIAYLGGLSWQKGVHVLIDAVNGLPAGRLHVSIYGDAEAFPDYVTHLKQLAQHPGIVFAGKLSHAEVWKALSEADAVVVPSVWQETSSLVTQEAFAAHVPVIASDIGALSNRIRDGVDGLLFPPGDSGALRTVLLRLIDDRDLLPQLRDGIQPVRTMDEHVNDIGAIYATVVESSKKG